MLGVYLPLCLVLRIMLELMPLKLSNFIRFQQDMHINCSESTQKIATYFRK